MATSETHAAELVEAGLKPERAATRLRNALLSKLDELTGGGENGDGARYTRDDALQELFPTTVLEHETLQVLVTSLAAGSNVLVLGPPGSGKTTLAKVVWDLYPKELFAVADCPVHDDPFSLIDPAFARVVPPCPYCKANHAGLSLRELGEFDATMVEPSDVPVRKVRLREGYGFARVQGSPEVFPDNLTGSINLARLEEIGDPTSPLVLEPGKLLQAHRGILLVDEVGKLPRGTQNVLLQALQEAIVSPAKSRETFPADLVAVTTSNLQDMGNITEPLNDRLTNVYTPFPTTPAKNRRIVDIGLAADDGLVYIPGPYRDAAVRLIMAWRDRVDSGQDLSEVGSNRTLIDVVKRMRSYALVSGDRSVDVDDFHHGARDAMAGRIRARSQDGFDENTELVGNFVDKHWREAASDGAKDYWCAFFIGELKEDEAEGKRVVDAVEQAVEQHGGDIERLQALIRAQGGDKRVRRFAQYVQDAEGLDRERVPEVLPAVFTALKGLGAFDGEGCGGRGRNGGAQNGG